MKERTYVDDVDRSVYDIKDEENDAYRIKSGLDASIVEKFQRKRMIPCGCRISVCSHFKFIMNSKFQTGDRLLTDLIWTILQLMSVLTQE